MKSHPPESDCAGTNVGVWGRRNRRVVGSSVWRVVCGIAECAAVERRSQAGTGRVAGSTGASIIIVVGRLPGDPALESFPDLPQLCPGSLCSLALNLVFLCCCFCLRICLCLYTHAILLASFSALRILQAALRQMSTMASRSHLVRLPEQSLRRAAFSSKRSCLLWQSSRALSSSALGSQRASVLSRKSLSLLTRYDYPFSSCVVLELTESARAVYPPLSSRI